ncbi:MAG: single-stranded DNA-binding protein [Propionibacteriaceae bacterium]|jgi:single-stranded DNA-binding protein|nr:single-stranded DNA-binding protein [Propionibacteriaceae bacterium]
MPTTIITSGRLTGTPELKTDDAGKVSCWARIIVHDRRAGGRRGSAAASATGYDVYLTGETAERLVDVATRCGDVNLIVAGALRTEDFARRDGTTGQARRVFADFIGVSLLGQRTTVEKDR